MTQTQIDTTLASTKALEKATQIAVVLRSFSGVGETFQLLPLSRVFMAKFVEDRQDGASLEQRVLAAGLVCDEIAAIATLDRKNENRVQLLFAMQNKDFGLVLSEKIDARISFVAAASQMLEGEALGGQLNQVAPGMLGGKKAAPESRSDAMDRLVANQHADLEARIVALKQKVALDREKAEQQSADHKKKRKGLFGGDEINSNDFFEQYEKKKQSESKHKDTSNGLGSVFEVLGDDFMKDFHKDMGKFHKDMEKMREDLRRDAEKLARNPFKKKK